MALADIIKRIDMDARSEASEILAAAEARAEQVKAQAVKDAHNEREAHLAHVEAQAQEDARTMVASARLHGRDRVLAEKRVLIERAFAQTVANLESMDDAAYAALVAREVAIAARGGESVRPAANDAARLGPWLAAAIAEAGAKVETAEPTTEIGRGVLLQGNRMCVEVSVSAMAQARRAEIEALVSEHLFGGDG